MEATENQKIFNLSEGEGVLQQVPSQQVPSQYTPGHPFDMKIVELTLKLYTIVTQKE